MAPLTLGGLETEKFGRVAELPLPLALGLLGEAAELAADGRALQGSASFGDSLRVPLLVGRLADPTQYRDTVKTGRRDREPPGLATRVSARQPGSLSRGLPAAALVGACSVGSAAVWLCEYIYSCSLDESPPEIAEPPDARCGRRA